MNIDIQHYRDNPPTISLMCFGLHCNFKCEHCMYSCGPNRPKLPFSTEALNKVSRMVDALQALDIFPSVNLVGGEPTADLDEFERILDHAISFDCEIQMTTNGWWLHEVGTTRRFFEIVGKHVHGESPDECGDHGFSVRISNDMFHDEFRPPHLQRGKIKAHLDNLLSYDGFDEDGVFYRSGYYCDDCYDWVGDDPCPNSGEDHDVELEDGKWWCLDCDKEIEDPKEHRQHHHVYWEDEELCHPPIYPDPNYPWIYAQDAKHDAGWMNVIPCGRGANGGRNNRGCTRYSSADDLTFMPDGRLMDICCKGAWAEFGTLDDHPLMLLELGRRFAEEIRPSCYSCRFDAESWAEQSLETERRRLQPDIDLIEEYADEINDWLDENPDWTFKKYLEAEGIY